MPDVWMLNFFVFFFNRQRMYLFFNKSRLIVETALYHQYHLLDNVNPSSYEKLLSPHVSNVDSLEKKLPNSY